jgi:FkbM family methyltransferase
MAETNAARGVNMLLRKLKPAASLLLSGKGAGALRVAAGRNVRAAHVRARRGRPFGYRTELGVRFVCIPESATSVWAYVGGVAYEEAEARLCQRWLAPGDTCLDFGANIGLFTVLLAETVGPQGKVIAVEPAPETCRHLREAVGFLGLTAVRVEEACVSDQPGEARFMVARGATSDMFASLKIGAEEAGAFEEARVVAVTVDELVARHAGGAAPALVRIDVEGAEPLALRGATGTLGPDAPPLFLIEVTQRALAKFGSSPAELLRSFPPDHFELFHVQHSLSDVTPRFRPGVLYRLPDPAAHSWPWFANVLAVPRVGTFAPRRERITSLLEAARDCEPGG